MDFNFDGLVKNRQTVKLKRLPNFPVLRYSGISHVVFILLGVVI